MKVGIFVNANKDRDFVYLKRVENILEKRKITYSIYKSFEDDSTISGDFFQDINFVVVLGGDGTMLHATRETAPRNIPIFGINIGNLGFLTEIDYNGFERAIDLILNNEYIVEERMLLSCDIDGRYFDIVAVNDICVISETQGKMIALEANVNGNFVDRYVGDGVIISSPTGSTGYSLSAGGPIVSPEAKCIILTPICAHSLTSKPLILSETDVIHISIDKNHKGLIVVDGQRKIYIKQKDVTVKISEFKAKFIRLKDYNFFNVLSKKFNNSINNK